MGVIISRYMDARYSEGALVRFIIESLQFMRLVYTSDSTFPDITPWNVITFSHEDNRAIGVLLSTFRCWPACRAHVDADVQHAHTLAHDELHSCGSCVPVHASRVCCAENDLLYVGDVMRVECI